MSNNETTYSSIPVHTKWYFLNFFSKLNMYTDDKENFVKADQHPKDSSNTQNLLTRQVCDLFFFFFFFFGIFFSFG